METEERELLAMVAVSNALKSLNDDEQYRVLQWAYNKYLGMNETSIKKNSGRQDLIDRIESDDIDDEPADHVNISEEQSYDTFAEMLDASGAKGEAQNVLVGAYWLQVHEQQASWKSFEVNKLLKDTGNQVKYMTNPVAQLMAKKPKQVVQVSKTNTKTGKGTKTMKLTTEGIKEVERMLRGGQ